MNLHNNIKKTPVITWVNHAGYVISFENINLLVDPWHTGLAFNNGWSLLTKTYFPANLRNKINYIWVSHEHPDHFSPRDLKSFDNKNKIKVIFQKTDDKRVVNFLKKLNFKTIELESFSTFSISKNFKITIIKNDQIDSASIMEVGGKIIINTNDCVLPEQTLCHIRDKMKIKQSDVLLTQFSYASWIGNPNQNELRKAESEEKLNQIQSQIKIFNPKVTIPFASYIYFCHEENKYMNDEITKLKKVKNIINLNGSKAFFLYPGSKLKIGIDSEEKFILDYLDYKKLFSKINEKKFFKSKKITYELLSHNSKKYLIELYKNNNKFIMLFFYYLSNFSNFFLKKDFFGFSFCYIYLTDIKILIKFDWKYGLRLIKNANKIKHVEIKISSDTLNYIFTYQWGIGSLMINGRGSYQNLYSKWKFCRVFSLGLINSTGKSLLKKVFEKLFIKAVSSLENEEASYLRNRPT